MHPTVSLSPPPPSASGSEKGGHRSASFAHVLGSLSPPGPRAPSLLRVPPWPRRSPPALSSRRALVGPSEAELLAAEGRWKASFLPAAGELPGATEGELPPGGGRAPRCGGGRASSRRRVSS
ncbi:hypothetical protein PVAP13_1KG187277 [Panicum virgatum]|uniref:Uncharacterized protein n=1 Tax=Panicum virgatum TaxID=38727 RepID=A0A8T0X6N3_PANVG|nr:hypothetical protein PVAP13_1KG187277 [Panicum virgatum]